MLLKALSRFSSTLLRNYFTRSELTSLQSMKKYVEITRDLTLEQLAQKIGIHESEVVKVYLDIEGLTYTEPEVILSRDTIEILINEFNCLPIWKEQETKVQRPPIVTIMGHVDHGKTTLLDSLRNSSICATEFGGITQGIGAFTVKTSEGTKITFIDTPGHLAFSNMRARGAEITDLIILVVCAVEGVQPQTIECINHAKACDVPIIVAINKVDLAAAEVERVEIELLKAGLDLDKHGGETLHVPISGKKRIGLDKLEEAILFKSELMDLRESVDVKARGYVLESKILPGRGSLCSVIVKRGTLRPGDIITAGSCFGVVKKLIDEAGKDLKEITLSQAAELIGFKGLPESGSPFLVVDDIYKAGRVARRRIDEKGSILLNDLNATEEKVIIPKTTYSERQQLRNKNVAPIVERLRNELEKVETGELDPLEARSINQLHKRVDKSIQEQIENISMIFAEKKDPNSVRIILKANNFGMLEAVERSVRQIETKTDVKIKIVKANVGGISQEDLKVAEEYDVPIFCMNVKLDKHIISAATKANVSIKSHKIIYHLLEDIENLVKDVTHSTTEVHHGKADIKDIFEIAQGRNKIKVAGLQVSDGSLIKRLIFRVERQGEVIAENLKAESLKVLKENAKEVKKGMECGLIFNDFYDFQIGDVITCYEIKELPKSFKNERIEISEYDVRDK